MGRNACNSVFTYFAAAVLAVVFLITSNSASAMISDDRALIEGAKLCTSYLPRQEREYGIPVHLLAAIASTESGRYNKELGLSLPWPWTINVDGKGYFFDTKEEAIAAVRDLQARGYQSIDVGCMQVNLHHHPNAFSNLEQAFDPAYNVAYAAYFLKQNFQDEGSWRKATADYHSRSPIFGEPYAHLVFSAWGRIINKIADARAGRLTAPELKAEAPTTMSSGFAHWPPRHTYHALHMHSISVSHDVSSENGVLVIRPNHSNVAYKQEASADENFVVNKPPPSRPSVVATPIQPSTTKGAEVIKVAPHTNTVAKGQFEGGAIHTISSQANAPAADQGGKQNSVFVFDN